MANGIFESIDVLYPSRVVCPVEQCLALTRAAVEGSAGTVVFYLSDVAADGSPAADLALVVGAAAAHVISAVPLAPASRVFVIEPAFFLPHRERL